METTLYSKAGNLTLLVRGLGIICALSWWPAQAGPQVQVLSSIKPVQLIVDAIAGNSIDSQLLLSAQVSPHDFALRFSDLRRIKRADLVVWLGPQFEHYLVKPLQQRVGEKTISLLADLESDGYRHDPHIWLDPLAVVASAERIASALIAVDPANAEIYRRQLVAFQAQLQQLHQRIAARFIELAGRGVLTTHAGLQHFLQRYGLKQLGSIYSGAEELLSLKRIESLRRRVERDEARCIMLEPQYEHDKIRELFKGLDVNAVELDVLGTRADSYEALLTGVSDAVYRCLVDNNAGADAGSGDESASAK